MRSIAALLGLCVFSNIGLAAEWSSPQAAQARLSPSGAPAILYNPQLTIEEFNRQVAERNPNQFLLVDVSMPREDLNLQQIIDRPATFAFDDQVFKGRVSAIFLPGDGVSSPEVRVFAQIENQQRDGKWILQPGATGVLSIRR